MVGALLSKIFAADLDGFDKYWKIRSLPCINTLTRKYRLYLWRRLMKKFGAYIPLNVDIARDVIFPHGIAGVFISEGAVVDSGCVIFQQVTIGSNTLSDSPKYGAPKIGKKCYVGCGAKNIGAVTVGENSRIGANCVIVDDIPCNSTAVLPKSVVIRHDLARDNTYKQWNEH